MKRAESPISNLNNNVGVITPTPIKGQIDALKKLGLNDTEIADVLECDKRIDKGEPLFTLKGEKEKASKIARSSGNTQGYTKPKTPTKKPNIDKQELIQKFAQQCENVNIINQEREFTFKYKGTIYKLVLSCPRMKK